jgi:fatty acid desaturase
MTTRISFERLKRLRNALADAVDWPTIPVIGACYGAWGLGVFVLPEMSVALAVLLLSPVIALHSSLTHEAIHGHPTRSEVVNAALLLLPLTVWIPYLRFKDMHLAHHHDELLTDPYDDPESNFLDPVVWDRLSAPTKWILKVNNTLAGRIIIGPLVGLYTFIAGDLRAIRTGDRRVLTGWLLHLPPLAVLVALLIHAPLPVWAYLLAVHLALGILKIRTFLEHRAHEKARGRTVVIEDRGPLAFLFLNNNFHVVHHMHPRVAWYQLPALYRSRAEHYLSRNDGYHFGSYADVFRSYFWTAKDPVPHPLRPPVVKDGQHQNL